MVKAGNVTGRIAPAVIAIGRDTARATPMDRRVGPGDDSFTWRPTAEIESIIPERGLRIYHRGTEAPLCLCASVVPAVVLSI